MAQICHSWRLLGRLGEGAPERCPLSAQVRAIPSCRRLTVPGGKVANRDTDSTESTDGTERGLTLSTAPPHVFYLEALFDII